MAFIITVKREDAFVKLGLGSYVTDALVNKVKKSIP